jgi:hypothetical protein
MSSTSTVVQGAVTADGTLELSEKVNLPAGPVQVIIIQQSDPFLLRMEKIRADLKASGYVPRSAEEIEAERRALRDESEEEIQEAIRIHMECEEHRKRAAEKEETK